MAWLAAGSELSDGTSMAAPHVAGSAALLMGLHPDWTPSEVQSALMLTAHTNIIEHDNTNQANSFARGSGQIQVALAAATGLVLDETNQNFRNAQHTNDLKALNLASMADSKCVNRCTWTRTFRNTLNTPVQWLATSSDPALTISPSSFTIPAKGTQTLTISFNVSNKATDSFVHAQVNLRTPSNLAPAVQLPVAVKPVIHNIEPTQSYSEFSGTFSKSHNVVTKPINSIGIEQVGMTRTTTWTGTLAQGQKAVLSVQSNKQIYRLIAEIRASNANNLNLIIYHDTNNNGLAETSDTIVCRQTNAGWQESCFLSNRAAGQYLIEVHNVAAGSEPNSSFELDWALVDSNNNNLTLSIPSTNPQGNAFTITEHFNLNSQVGDKWYGSYKLINNDTSSELARVDIDYEHIADQPSVITILSGDQQQSQVASSFAQPLSVQISDQHGNPIVNERVTYASPSSGASAILSPDSFAITNQDGIATLNANANSITGSYTVTASLGSLQANFRLSNTPGAATQLAILSGDQQSTTVTNAFSDTLSLSVRDSHNNPVPNATVNFSSPSSGASAQLSSQTATTDANGIASINASANSIAGSYTVSTSLAGQQLVFNLSNTHGTFASLVLHAGNPQASTVGKPFAEPLSIKALDSHGNAIPNLSVQFAAPSNGASAQLSSQTASTDANGIASINASANSIAGSYTISATVGSQSVAFQLSNNADSIASLVLLSGDQQSATVSSVFSETLSVQALDSYGNPVGNTAIAFSVPSSGASASLDHAIVSTGADGIATVQASANTIAGSYSVSASVGSQRVEFKLSNTPNSTIQIEIVSGNQQSTRVDSAFAQPLQVRLSDSYGNPLPNLIVQFSAPTRGPSAQLAQLSATTDSDGLASVQASANTIAGSYRISVSSGKASANFTLTNTGTILFIPQLHKN